VRLTREGFEIQFSQDSPATQFAMADGIRPICIATSGNEIATAHALPIVHHWSATPKGLRHLAALRGTTAPITALLCNAAAALILCGHANGAISVFVTSPRHQFVREIKCFAREAITGVAYIAARATIVVLQLVKCQTIVTAWTVNGAFLQSDAFDFIAADVVATSFEEGVRKNVIIILTNGGQVVALKADSLRVTQRLAVDAGLVRGRLSIWKDKMVFLRAGRHLAGWALDFPG
jgi:hypothetical protein